MACVEEVVEEDDVGVVEENAEEYDDGGEAEDGGSARVGVRSCV